MRTRNNTDGNKLVIFSGIASYYGDKYNYIPRTTTKLSTLFQVLMLSQVTLEIFFLGLGLTVTEICIIKVQKQDLKKNIKKVKGCRDGMPKSMQTR